MNTQYSHTSPTEQILSPADRGLTQGDDGRWRIPWGNASPELQEYYDHEWARPIRTEHGMFERLVLEGFQAGLSWSTILNKRPALREAFAGFSTDRVAAFSESDIERLLANAAIIRNRQKIEAAIHNARVVCATRESAPLVDVIERYAGERTEPFERVSDIPTRTEGSAALARELKGLGYRFVGPTTCYALLQAVGLEETRVRGESRCEETFSS